MECRVNVGMKGFEVHDCGGSEYWGIEYGYSEGGCKLFVSKHRSEIVRINSCIIPFPLFRIDICLLNASGLVLSQLGWKQIMRLN